jgi:carbamoyl-phosphate synthase large subunit
MVIPSIEADLYKWAEDKEIIEQSGAVVMLNNPDLVDACKDKWDFYTELLKSGTSYAITTRLEGSFEELSSEFGLPFLLKPRKGFASRGIVRVDSEEIFNQNSPLLGSVLMAQPLVGNDDEEYSISAFCDGKGGVLASMSLKRKLAREGFTEKAEVVDLPEIKKAIADLSAYFKPLGPTNFQFRADAESLKLLEINPRISSATSIRTAFGYNESEMAVNYYLNNIIPSQPEIKEGKAIRYTEDLIVYNENRNYI